MVILKYITAMATIMGAIAAILYLCSPKFDFYMFLFMIILFVLLVMLCYFIEDKIKIISDDNDKIKSNCNTNVSTLNESISKLGAKIDALNMLNGNVENRLNQLNNRVDTLNSTILSRVYPATKEGHPDFIKEGSYILTEEGEMALPEELKKKIMSHTQGVKIKSPEDAFSLLSDDIGRDRLKEFAEESKLQFYEIIALSTLYAIKVSKENE